MEVLKRRLRDKVCEIQRDASTIQTRLDEQERVQTSLDRWKQKLQADLDQAFTHLHELIERQKQELSNKVDKVIGSGRRTFTQQNTNCRDCLASVNKACDEATELLKEDNKTTFLATHNKVSQQLEECFVELLMLEEAGSCTGDVVDVEQLEKCFKEFSLATEDPSVGVALKDTSTDISAGNERGHNVTKQTILQEIPSLGRVDMNDHRTVNCTSVVSQYSVSIPSHTDNKTFVSCECATSDSENSIAFQQCTTAVSFANIPVSVRAPFTFTAAPHSHPSPVHLDSNLFSLPADTVSTSTHKSSVTANFSSPLAVPTTDLKISITTKESDPLSVLCSSTNLATHTSSTYSTTAVIQCTTVSNSVSLPIAASVAKVSLVPSNYVSDTKMSTAVLTPTATFGGGAAMKTSCVVSTLAKTSSTVKTMANKKICSKRNKAVSSTPSAVATVKSDHQSTGNATIGYMFDVKQGDEVECVITEVVSPSEFWVQPVGYELISLMNSMGSYYTWLEKDGDYGGLKEPPRVGDFCCARFSQDMRWYRVRVLSFIHDRVEVLYVDYGNKEEVPLSSLRPLDYRFVILPCQAIKCSLKVKPAIKISAPVLKGSVVSQTNIPQWPMHTKKWLKTLLMGKRTTVLFLTPVTSNHAQVDIAVTRENFLSSLSCLHGILSIGEGVKQFLQSTQFSPLYALCGVSKFMCAVKLAIVSSEKHISSNTTVMPFSANHSFCGSSVFPFPMPTPSGSVFLHRFPTVPQYSLYPFMVHPNPPQPLFSPGFIQPVVSPPPSSSPEMVSEAGTVDRCQSENDDSRNCQTPKKRSASLTASAASNLPNDLQHLGGSKTKVKKLSESAEKSSSGHSPLQQGSSPASCLSGTHVTSEIDTELPDQSLLLSSSLSSSGHSKLSIASLGSSSTSIDVATLSQVVVTAVPTSTGSPLLSSRNSSVSSVPTTSESPRADYSTVTVGSPSVAMVESQPSVKSTPTSVVNKYISPKFHNIAALSILSSVISNECLHHNVVVSHVVSPSEFYLNFLSDTEEIRSFDSFQKLLNEHYEEEEIEEDLSTLLCVGVICCARYTDGTWNRAIVRDVKPQESSNGVNKYLIQYVDFGNYQWVAVKNIQPLKEEFLSQPALTVRCTLVGVIPCNDRRRQKKKTRISSKVMMTAAGAEDDFKEECNHLSIRDSQQFSGPTKKTEDDKTWSQEALDWFNQLTGKMLVATLSEEVMMLSWDDSLEVGLIDTNGSTDIDIVADLVSRGLAKSNGKMLPASKHSKSQSTEIPHQDQVNSVNEPTPSAILHPDNTSTPKVGSETLLSPTDVAMDAWNPMESHFLSNWNIYQGNSSEHKLAGRGSGTRRGKQEVNPNDGAAISKFWKMQTVTLPAENACVPVVITAIYSPVRFWVHLFPSNTNSDDDDKNVCGITLSQLCEEMNKECSRSVFKGRESDIVAHGELVAAMSPEDKCWYRAVLKDYDDNTSSVLVAFVDFGDTAWLKETNICCLHSKFLHLPIQAVECTLDGMKLNKDVDFNWAMEEFSEMVKDKAFAAHIVERDTVGNRLSLELYKVASSSGISVNLKDEMVTREIALRNNTKNSVSSNSIPGRHQKVSSLPG